MRGARGCVHTKYCKHANRAVPCSRPNARWGWVWVYLPREIKILTLGDLRCIACTARAFISRAEIVMPERSRDAHPTKFTDTLCREQLAIENVWRLPEIGSVLFPKNQGIFAKCNTP